MWRVKRPTRKFWYLVPVFLGLLLYSTHATRQTMCEQTIIVDLAPIPGETWARHSARMDDAARRACREFG